PQAVQNRWPGFLSSVRFSHRLGQRRANAPQLAIRVRPTAASQLRSHCRRISSKRGRSSSNSASPGRSPFNSHSSRRYSDRTSPCSSSQSAYTSRTVSSYGSAWISARKAASSACMKSGCCSVTAPQGGIHPLRRDRGSRRLSQSMSEKVSAENLVSQTDGFDLQVCGKRLTTRYGPGRRWKGSGTFFGRWFEHIDSLAAEK